MIVVIGAGIAAWWIWPEDGAAVSSKPPYRDGRIREVKQQAPVRRAAETNASPAVAADGTKDNPFNIAEVLNVKTNLQFGKIYTKVRRKDGLVGTIISEAHPPTFSCGTDQLLQMALCGNPHVGIPPMPMGAGDHDKAFLKSLEHPIEISEDDSEEVRRQKEIVRDAREQIRELMAQGHHFDDILSDYRRITSENNEIRAKAMRELNEIHASGDAKAEREYQIRIDAALQQMGIDPLDEPMTREERRAAREARRAEREAAKAAEGNLQ